MSKELYQLDRKHIHRSFDQAARRYDEAAVLQKEVGARLLERLDLIRFTPKKILDIGAGTGYQSELLYNKYPDAELISLDLSHTMLQMTRNRNKPIVLVCADAQNIPLVQGGVDLIFSNLTLQWCDVSIIFKELRRVLKKDGLLMFSTFGPDTLWELRDSWSKVDQTPHVNTFIDMHDIGDALVMAGFKDTVMDVDRFKMTYDTAYKLMADLKQIGAHNVNRERTKSLTGKTKLRAMINAYESHRCDGLLPASYEVVYGHGWGGMQHTPGTANEYPLMPMPYRPARKRRPR